ncbi:S8 family serine peptidase [Lysobacter brunescens]|uniref:S8 family serine peptidase n=1 Tax=Lysobacter brunescens TaxID=262323 RepID=A0ABW2YDR3_9GAMM
MNHRTTLLSTAVGLSLACASLTATAGEFRTVKQPIPGQYIVVLKDNAASLANERSSLSRVSVVARDIAAKHRTKLVRSYNNVLRGFVARADDKGLARLLADPRVAYVQEDGVVSITASQSNATWGIDRIDQRNLPLNQTYTYDTTASTVHAYVIDTGILLNHSQFSGRMGNGYDAVSSGGNANDCNGHGTHVAGTIGGSTYGVAKEVKLHPVRVLGCNGSGANSGVIAGMDWVAENHVKPAVANMSLGGSADQATDDAVNRLHNAGVTVVVAAGNNSGNACSYSPARAANAITVGSTTNTDARSSFSNFGSCLDIYGPGSNILSAWYTSSTATNTISGTSMASPHVAGVAALYLANNPNATPTQVRNAIVDNATSGKVTDAGSGSPNKLLYSIFGGGENPPPPPDTYSVSGTITNASGTGISGVTVSNGTVSATTSSSGAYTLTGLANGTYTLTPSLGGYTFSPASRSVTVNSANVTGVDFTGTANGGGGDGQTYTNDFDYFIFDNFTIQSPIVVSGRSGNASATTQVKVKILHTYIGELKVDLVAPDGSVYVLHNRSGGSADNIDQTYTVNLSGEALNGMWTLRVNDNAWGDTGRLDSWSITF